MRDGGKRKKAEGWNMLWMLRLHPLYYDHPPMACRPARAKTFINCSATLDSVWNDGA